MAHLFDPFTLKNLTIRNRFVMAPMTRGRANRGVPTDAMVEYYRRRAAGGLGMIITEGTLIEHPLANAYGDVPYLRQDAVDGWQRVNDAIRKQGCVSFVQVWHCGPISRPGVAAFALEKDGVEVVQAATEADKSAFLDLYRRSAELAVQSGFDGLELHGAHGYFLDSFLRSGQPEFVQEVVRVTRAAVGPDFPIVLRFSTWTIEDFGAAYVNTPDQLEALLGPLKEAGVDVFHPSVRRYWEPAFAGSDLTMAGWTKQLGGLPTIAVGSIGLEAARFAGDGPEGLSALKQRLADDEFDFAAVGRALLTEPDWVNKVLEGRLREIIPWYPDAAREIYP